ncbi:hypothetical protein FPHOBKDP_00136 [Listeria phage LPJP1]|nr:hypothetical protein FPHOBKDP_00136 [Listeria phage LPJP1]
MPKTFLDVILEDADAFEASKSVEVVDKNTTEPEVVAKDEKADVEEQKEVCDEKEKAIEKEKEEYTNDAEVEITSDVSLMNNVADKLDSGMSIEESFNSLIEVNLVKNEFKNMGLTSEEINLLAEDASKERKGIIRGLAKKIGIDDSGNVDARKYVNARKKLGVKQITAAVTSTVAASAAAGASSYYIETSKSKSETVKGGIFSGLTVGLVVGYWVSLFSFVVTILQSAKVKGQMKSDPSILRNALAENKKDLAEVVSSMSKVKEDAKATKQLERIQKALLREKSKLLKLQEKLNTK